MGARQAENGSGLGHAEYFAELIDEWAPEGHADERLYRLGSSVIDAFADGAATERLARYFEFWLLRLQGVYPRLSACPECGGAVDGRAPIPAPEPLYFRPRCAVGGGTAIPLAALKVLPNPAGPRP